MNTIMDWNRVPDDVKRIIIKFTGGFREYHSSIIRGSLNSIRRRSSEYICYVCGLQDTFLHCGLKRKPSTRMYARKNKMSVEIYGRCFRHRERISSNEVMIPRDVETNEDIHKFLKTTFSNINRVFIFTSMEDKRIIWKPILLDELMGSQKRSGSCCRF